VFRECKFDPTWSSSLVEFIYMPTGGSRVTTTVVLSRGVRQSCVYAMQDVSTSPVPVRRHSQCRSGLQWCPVGGAVPRRRSSGSVQSGRSGVCAKKDKESSSTESTTPEAVHRLLRVTQHPPPLHELHRHSLSAGAPGSRLRVFGFRGARPG